MDRFPVVVQKIRCDSEDTLRHQTIICLFLLLMASYQPSPLISVTEPSLAPVATVTGTTTPATSTPATTVVPSVTVSPQPTLTATPDRLLIPPITREVAFAYHFWSEQLVAFDGLDPNLGG